MYESLQPIAQLKIGKVMDQLAEERMRQLVETSHQMAGRGMIRSGGAEAAKFNIHASTIEKICRTISDTWIELLIKDHKSLTRDDLTFIMQQVESFALPEAKSLATAMTQVPGGSLVPGDYWSQQAETKIGKVAGDIRRDLEIQFREEQAFPPRQEVVPVSSTIQLHIHDSNISNLNLGTQQGIINSALQTLASEGKEHQALANAIKQLTEAVVADQQLKDDQKQEAVDALAAMADDDAARTFPSLKFG
jgi:hypothetical protein